jgi:hypothetical protein
MDKMTIYINILIINSGFVNKKAGPKARFSLHAVYVYASTMAPDGQHSRHVPHSMHFPVILYAPPFIFIASFGHSAMHVPQAMHSAAINTKANCTHLPDRNCR